MINIMDAWRKKESGSNQEEVEKKKESHNNMDVVEVEVNVDKVFKTLDTQSTVEEKDSAENQEAAGSEDKRKKKIFMVTIAMWNSPRLRTFMKTTPNES